MLLIYLSCSWLAGIFLGSKLDLPPALVIAGLVPLPLLLFSRQRRKAIILTSLCLITLLVAVKYSFSSLNTIDDSDLHFYNGRGTVEIRGLVSQDSELRDKSAQLRLDASEIKLAQDWQKAKGTALLIAPRYPEFKYGDTLLVKGKLETPPQIDDFDYKGYLAHQGIYTTMLYPTIEVVDRGSGFKPLEWTYSLRNRLAETLARVLPEPEASLAQGIVLGIRSSIPTLIKTAFVQSGTAHILAISGLNLGIVAGIMLSLGIWLFGRRHYIYVWLALSTVWLYALLTGMNPPVLRGAIMTSLFLFAELLGRQRSALTALTFAAAIMVGVSPYILWDASFQLSFLAMAGLVFLFPAFRTLGRRIAMAAFGEGNLASTASFVSDSLSATLAATLAVLPAIAYYFGIVSFIGPLATLLVLPALPGAIITGAIAGLLGFIALPLAQAVGWVAWLFLLYIVALARGLAAPSLSSVEVGSISPPVLWAYYSVLAAGIWLYGNRSWFSRLAPAAAWLSKSVAYISNLPKKWAFTPLIATAVLVSFAGVTMPDDKVHVSFLDVGEGDAILIQRGHQQVLIDGGPSSQAITPALSDRMPFWDRTIDLLVLTHPHQDHLAGLLEVLRRYRVEQVLCPDITYESPVYDEWRKTINEQNIKNTIARAGQQLSLGDGVTLKVLSPLAPVGDDIDNNSVVLRLDAGEVGFLFAADIGKEREWELARERAELNSTILKVAHHGSDTSTCGEFLNVASPQIAVISVGADNKFGHPSPEVLDRLSANTERISRTDQQGTIEFITDGERLWAEVNK